MKLAILALLSLVSFAQADPVRVNLLPTNLPPDQFDNVLIVMPYAPIVGEKIHLQGKLYKVKSREWDADSATLHCKVTVTLTN